MENIENQEVNTNGGNQPLSKKERKALRKQEKESQKKAAEKKSSMGMILGLVIMLVIIVGGILFSSGGGGQTYQSPSLTELSDIDHFKGNNSAPNLLVEYSDFQCPACGIYYPMIKQLAEEEKENVKVVYRHFPLKRIHPLAEMAAEASEAAGKQNKFWEYHDMLFERQARWSGESRSQARDLFEEFAEELELDVEQFKKDMKSVSGIVDAHYKSGLGAGVNATPSFFLNGQRVQASTLDEFKALLK